MCLNGFALCLEYMMHGNDVFRLILNHVSVSTNLTEDDLAMLLGKMVLVCRRWLECVKCELPIGLIMTKISRNFTGQRKMCNTVRQLLAEFAGHVVYRKKDIPIDVNFVIQAQYRLDGRTRDCFPFFIFRSVRDLLLFFHVWSKLQLSGKSNGVFVMECTRQLKKKKWVIDLDGDLNELFAVGLIKDKGVCSFTEAECIEKLAIEYGALRLKCLHEIGFLGASGSLWMSMTRRHRPATEGGYSKLSLHITLGVMATHGEWRRAIHASGALLSKLGSEEVLKMCVIDDQHVASNSMGQNMSILHASKPVGEREVKQPLFSFAGCFVVNLESGGGAGYSVNAVKSWNVTGERLSETQYRLSSMLVESGLECERCSVWAMKSQLQFVAKDGKDKINGKRGLVGVQGSDKASKAVKKTILGEGELENSTLEMLRSNTVQWADFPGFGVFLLNNQGVSFLNDQMPSLFKSFPPVIPEIHKGVGHVKMVKVERPLLCIRYLISRHKRRVYRHEQNGCLVSQYLSGTNE